VACGYMRQNITQEVWAEIFDTSQPVISGIIAKFTPLIEASTEEDRPGRLQDQRFIRVARSPA
jgi:hypothetical protein